MTQMLGEVAVVTTSGRMVKFNSSVDAMAAICPTAIPTSIALANSQARGSGITLPTITPT